MKKVIAAVKRKPILAIAIILAVLVLAVTALSLFSDKSTNTPVHIGSSARRAFGNESYSAYLSKTRFKGNFASKKIVPDIFSYETSGGLAATESEDGVATEGIGSIKWKFTVEEEGFYNLKLKYSALYGCKTDFVRSIKIDDEALYEGLDQITLLRSFDNMCGEELEMINGSEIRPIAEEVFDWQEVYIEDSLRRESEPYIFYLSEGEHTVTFDTVEEPLMLYGGLEFSAAHEPEPYKDTIEKLKKDYPVYDGENIVFQAERTSKDMLKIYKTSASIRNLTDYTSPNSVPFHPYNSMLNTIGGNSWQTPGQKLSWEIKVEKEGLYAISFRARQSVRRGILAFRKLTVNGETPFAEAANIGFSYSTDFLNYTIGTEQEPYLFYFKSGVNIVSLEVVAGDCIEPITAIENSIDVLNDLYRRVIRITGTAPDKYIDYEIEDKVPDFTEVMKQEADRLYETVEYLQQMTGEKGELTASVEKMAIQAERLAEEPEDVINELDAFQNNISSLGTALTSLSEFPLEIDGFTLYSPEKEPKKAEAGFFRKLYAGTVRFFSTFFIDETKLDSEDASTQGEELRVWMLGGRDQLQIVKSLVDGSFVYDGVKVNLQLIPLSAVLPSTLADNGPDVVINMSYDTVMDYAMRGALVDLSALEGFEEQKNKYYESAIDNVTFQEGVYGLPETQSFLMMYCRDDVLDEMGLEAPRTWKEFEEVMVKLNSAEYDVYMPGVSLYNTLVYQYGGDIYEGEGKDYGIKSGLYTESSMQAFQHLTKYYTGYSVPLSANFANRFRSGEMPIGIADYTLYNTLELFAPEIRGLWSFYEIPGVEGEDGAVNNATISTSTNTVIMSGCDNIDAAWSFLRWWSSTETQLSYAQSLEAVLGRAGRYATANKEVLNLLSWSNKSLAALQAQFEKTLNTPVVPGNYMTTRMIGYAFNDVVTDSQSMSAKEALYLNIRKIDDELSRKRKEFGHSYYDEKGVYVTPED